ncbi:MAG: sensor histidine kinase [Planctomycetota bacterium]
MRFPLRLRVLGLVFLINALVFGAGLGYLAGRLAEARIQEVPLILDDVLSTTIVPGGDLKVAEILSSRQWRHFADAIVVDKNLERARGTIQPLGVFLNPLGSAGRSATFDREAVLADIASAIDSRGRVEGPLGTAVPVYDPTGSLWGGCWYRLEPSVDARELVASLLPWFVLSTLLLTLGTFFIMRRFVLDPVEVLARGSERLSAGDLSVRLPEPERRDELSDLIRRWNAMAATVQEFNATLAREVARATEQARTAEAAAMTQRRLAATGELAAGVAHEINNPLGGLLNAAEALSRENLPPDKRAQYLGLLSSGLERIQATVGRLLRLAPRTARPQSMTLDQPIADAVGLVQHRAAQQRVSIELTCEGRAQDALERMRRLPAVLGEANELAQAVLNLLVNSLDALGGGPGRIGIDVAREGRELVLSVVDDGPGVSEEELPHVADAFYTTKEVGKGTGLGLAIVHNVAASHGGRVVLRSRPGEGFRAEIRLPLPDDRP